MDEFVTFLRQLEKKAKKQVAPMDTEIGQGQTFSQKIAKLEKFVYDNEFVDKQMFMDMMLDINFDHKKIADMYYDKQFKGLSVFCCCFKRCLRSWRHDNVTKEYDEF